MLIPLICDLLEIVFHHILFIKHVYPELSFQKKQKYNVPTWKSKHPGVCQYIASFIEVARKVLEIQKALSAILSITTKDGVKIEEFVFKVHLVEKEGEDSTPDWNVEDMLTGLCVSISIVDPLEKVIKGDSFELKIMTNSKILSVDDVKADLENKDFPWNVLKKSKFDLWTKILPVKTVDNEDYLMQIYRKSKSSLEQ